MPRTGRDDGASAGPNPLALLGLGFAAAVCVAGGMALGWFLDRQLGTAPVFILLGLASGIVLGVFGTIVEVRRHLNG
jgi:F0F1-type ATP synthase assembly protein I